MAVQMGRSKRQKEEGQYVNLPYFQLRSEAWRSLSGAAVKVWLELHTRFKGTNNGRLFLSLNEAAESLGMGKATVQRAYVELEAKGFIVKTRAGNWYQRQAHEWRLTTKPTQKAKGKREPPTHDWKAWKPPPKKQKRGSKTAPSRIDLGPIENPEPLDGFNIKPVNGKTVDVLGSDMARY